MIKVKSNFRTRTKIEKGEKGERRTPMMQSKKVIKRGIKKWNWKKINFAPKSFPEVHDEIAKELEEDRQKSKTRGETCRKASSPLQFSQAPNTCVYVCVCVCLCAYDFAFFKYVGKKNYVKHLRRFLMQH